jgi:hypothetical protein
MPSSGVSAQDTLRQNTSFQNRAHREAKKPFGSSDFLTTPPEIKKIGHTVPFTDA